MSVYLVGAGPGDPDLITVRGAELLRRADVVVYDGLASPALLELVKPGAERIYAGKKHSERGGPLHQDEIDALLVDRGRRGLHVVRLKGGDPFIFGRGGEEAEALAAAGVPFEVVPGVTAASAVPAYAGIPLTHRDAASTVAFATGHEAEDKEGEPVDWAALARIHTLVLFMSVKNLARTAASLIAAGRSPTTPCAVIRWGTTPAQETVTGTLADIAVRAAHLKPPGLVVVGDVVARRPAIAWFERRPLFGLRVLVTRPRAQAGSFAAALSTLGAAPITVEATRIEPPANRAPFEAALGRLPAGYAWVAFTSANAVERVFAALAAGGRDARAMPRVAAVGTATADALLAHGIRADLTTGADGAVLAQALRARLAEDVATDTTDETGGRTSSVGRVLLPRAEAGGDDLAVGLRGAGVDVDAVAVYRTVPSPPPSEPLGPIHVLTFFAPSQVDAVAAWPIFPELARARIIAAIGPTTAEAVRRHGLRVDVVPSTPTAEALAAALAEHVTHSSSRA